MRDYARRLNHMIIHGRSPPSRVTHRAHILAPSSATQSVDQPLRCPEAAGHGAYGLRVARAVDHVECRTARLVLEANQVAVRGFGMLFGDRSTGRNKIEER